MKNFIRIGLLLLSPLMIELIVSCGSGGGYADSNDPYNSGAILLDYPYCGMVVYHLDNSAEAPYISVKDSITKTAYGIRVTMSRAEKCAAQPRRGLFLASAMATSPAPRQYILADSIKSVKVKSINAFDQTHAQSSDITELFYVFTGTKYLRVAEYIDDHFTKEVVIEPMSAPLLAFDLMLMSPPTLGIEHRFEIEVELFSGSIFSTTTNPINLK